MPLQYGIWYTWYVIYTEQRAKHEIGNWTAAKFPLDVWGLDMNCEPGPPTFLSSAAAAATAVRGLSLTAVHALGGFVGTRRAKCRRWRRFLPR